MSEVFSNFFVATSLPLAQVIKFKLKTNWQLGALSSPMVQEACSFFH